MRNILPLSRQKLGKRVFIKLNSGYPEINTQSGNKTIEHNKNIKLEALIKEP